MRGGVEDMAEQNPCTTRTVIAPAAKPAALATPPSLRRSSKVAMIHTGSTAAPTIRGSRLISTKWLPSRYGSGSDRTRSALPAVEIFR